MPFRAITILFRTAITDLPKDLNFSDFYAKVTGLCTVHIPATCCAASKTSIPSIAAVASPTGAATSLAANQKLAYSATTCQPCCSEAVHDVIKSYGFAAVEGALKFSQLPIAHWMCENCCQKGHKKFECKNPPHPDRERLLAEHKAARADRSAKKNARKRAQSQNARNNSAAFAGGPPPANQQRPTGSGGNQQGGRSVQQSGNLKITFPNNIPQQGNTDRNVRPRASGPQGRLHGATDQMLNEAFANFSQAGAGSAYSDNSSRFEDVTDSMPGDSYSGGFHGAFFTTCDASTPDRAALPMFLLLAVTGFAAAQVQSSDDGLTLGLLTVLFPLAFCLYALLPRSALTTHCPHHAVRRPRSTLFSWVRHNCHSCRGRPFSPFLCRDGR